MAIYWPTLLRSALAVVFDEHAVYLLKLKKRRGSISLEHFSVTALPPNAVLAGKCQRADQVCTVLKQAVSYASFAYSHAYTAIPQTLLRSQRLTLPGHLHSSRNKMLIHQQLASWQAQAHLFFAYDVVRLASSKNEFLLCATPKESLQIWQHVFLASHLKLQCVDVESYALLRAFQFLAKKSSSHSLMLLIADTQTLRCYRYQASLVTVHRQWQLSNIDNIAAFEESCSEIIMGFNGSCYGIILNDTPYLTVLEQALMMHQIKLQDLTQGFNDFFANIVSNQQHYSALIALGLCLRGFGL